MCKKPKTACGDTMVTSQAGAAKRVFDLCSGVAKPARLSATRTVNTNALQGQVDSEFAGGFHPIPEGNWKDNGIQFTDFR